MFGPSSLCTFPLLPIAGDFPCRAYPYGRGCELPTFPPYDALVDLIGRFKGRWGRHAAECVDDVAAAVHGRAAAVAAELFGRFPRAHSAVGWVTC